METKPDINRDSVFDAFVKYKALSLSDFKNFNIFQNIEDGTDRKSYLYITIEGLEKEKAIKQTNPLPTPKWEIIEVFYSTGDIINKPIGSTFKTKKEHKECAIGIINCMLKYDLFEEYDWFTFSTQAQKIPPEEIPSINVVAAQDLAERILLEDKFVDPPFVKSTYQIKLNAKGRKLLKYNSIQIYWHMNKSEDINSSYSLQHIENNFGSANQMNDQSSIQDFRPEIKPSITPTTADAKQGKKTWLGKLLNKYIVPNINNIIITLLIAYLVYRLGWNK